MSNINIKNFADAGILWALPDDDPDLQRIRNLDTARYQGTLYGLPTSMQPQWGLLFYNKALFAEAGPDRYAEDVGRIPGRLRSTA